MIEIIDAHIEAQLEKITHEGSPVTVYSYLPDVDDPETVFPSIGMTRHTVSPDSEKARPNCEIFVPSETEVTIDVQADMALNEQLTGPESYTEKPYPTPVVMVYEIRTLATEKTDSDNLVEGVVQVLPPGYVPKINDQTPFFTITESTDLDDLDVPLYSKAFSLTVTDVWVDAIESWERQPILEIDLEVEA